MDLFELNGKVVVNLADALKAFNELQKEGQKTESKLSKFFSGIGKGAMALGKTVAVGIGVGATAFAGLAAKALSASGELEQNMGGSEAVFQEYAQTVQETAKKAYSSMGLSTSEFLATANKMGSLFKGAGFEASEAADITTKAMQRAADVASIMGIDAASAMESIAGAAKGNFTMMDNLGVAMNDTTLNAYALEKGLGKTTQQMTNQEKIGLAMEMFLEKTADYAGNYTKENETLAGSLGTAKAALMNFLDGSGSVDDLANAFIGALNSMIGSLESILPRLAEGIPQIVNKVAPMIPSLLEKLLPPIVQGASDLINGLISSAPQLLSLLLNTILPQLLSNLSVIFEAIVGVLPQAAQLIADALPTLIPQIITALVEVAVIIASHLPEIIIPILQKLPEIVISIVSSLAENLLPLVGEVFAPLKEGMSAIFDFVKQNEDVFIVLGIAIGALTAAVIAYNGAAIAKKAIDIAETIYLYALTAAQTAHTIATNIATVATTAFGVAMAFLTSPITLVVLAIGALIAIVVLCVKHWDDIKQAGAKAWEWIKNAWSKAGEWFSNLKDKIVGAFSNVWQKLTEPFTKARDKIKEVADKIKGFFKGEISMPKIKLPHFGISPKGWKIGDLLDGKIPKLSIDWYAKGAIMKKPTLFGYNPATGSLQAGGEAGDEAIAPISTLQQYVSAAVAEQNSVLVLRLDRITELLVKFFPEMLEALNINMYLDSDVLVAETADKYDVALGKIAVRKGRGR